MRKMLVAAVSAALVACSSGALAQEASKLSTPGLGIAGGFGYQFGGIGAHGSYYLPIGSDGSPKLVPYAGVGYFGQYGNGSAYGFAAGAMLQIGKGKHKGVLDFSYGTAAIGYSRWTDGAGLGHKKHYLFYGETVAGGYEYMARSGFYSRIMGGITLMNGVPYEVSASKTVATFTLAFGYKAW